MKISTKDKMLKIMRRVGFVLFFLLIMAIIWISTLISTGYQMYQDAVQEMPIADMIKQIKRKENYTTLEEMPELYVKAVVAIEDHRFYYHNGIDIVSIGGAFVHDLKTKSYAVGGSTITQQLAKNTYFTQEKKLTRKIAEVFAAIAYEKELEKDEILELYLNTCYFGDGCYTVKEASRKFFDKEPILMTDNESTMLAGVPNAPSVYAPTKNLTLAKQRQRQVLNKMVEYGVITLEKAQEIMNNDE